MRVERDEKAPGYVVADSRIPHKKLLYKLDTAVKSVELENYDILKKGKILLINKHYIMSKITIYSTPTCHFCHMAKDFFTSKGIVFEDFDVSTNLEKRKEMVDKSGQMGVPVILIDNNLVVGFNKPKIVEILGIKE